MEKKYHSIFRETHATTWMNLDKVLLKADWWLPKDNE